MVKNEVTELYRSELRNVTPICLYYHIRAYQSHFHLYLLATACPAYIRVLCAVESDRSWTNDLPSRTNLSEEASAIESDFFLLKLRAFVP